MQRSRGGGVLVVLTACAVVSCGGSTPATTGEGLVVSVGLQEPRAIVPSATNDAPGWTVVGALFTPLVDYDASLQPVEVAAKSIATSDNRVWTITLQPGWIFHNGEPVTSDSYINAWNAGAYGPNAHNGNQNFDKILGYADLNPTDRTPPKARKLAGLARKDDLTFAVTLAEPYFGFKSMLGLVAFNPLPLAAFSDLDNNVIADAFKESPIGQGPFKMKGVWLHDQVIEAERFEGYAGSVKPRIAGVTFKIYQQQATQYLDLLAGQLDIVPEVAPEDLASAQRDLGGRFKMSPTLGSHYLVFPTYEQKYSKTEVRKAISMAIDREEISRTIFLGSQLPWRTFVGPLIPGARPDACGEACEYNPVKARKLFEAAGGPAALGGRIELAYNVDGGHKTWVDAVCNQVKQNLGIECVGNPVPRFADLGAKRRQREPLGIYRFGAINPVPLMGAHLHRMYGTDGISNDGGYRNARFDALVAAGDRSATAGEAIRRYQEAEDMLATDLPKIPLWFYQNAFGHSPRVQNVNIDGFNRVDLLAIEPNTTP